MMFWLLVLGIIVLSLLGGAVGGYVCVRWQAKARTATHLSRTGYFCEVSGCGAEALPYRTHDGRRICAAHKGAA